MAPGLVYSWIFFVLSHTNTYRKALIINCSSPQQQFPMQRSCRLIEASRKDQDISPFLSHQQSQLSKSQIIANSNSHLTILGIKDTNVLAGSKSLRFFVCNFSRNINVKEVKFVILILQLSFWINHKGCIPIMFFRLSWNGSNRVHFVVAALLFDGIQSGRILKVFSKSMHICLCIWRIADFSKDRHVCTIFASIPQSFFDKIDILFLIRNTLSLQQSQLKFLHKIYQFLQRQEFHSPCFIYNKKKMLNNLFVLAFSFFLNKLSIEYQIYLQNIY